MGLFYETYERTGQAAALAHAVNAVSGRKGYRHPYFWPPFGVMGDKRTSDRLDG